MGAGLITAFALGGPPITDEIARARPALVPHGITTRFVGDSAAAAAQPTHVDAGAYRIDTVCDRTFCVEELRIGRHVAIAAAAAIAALHRELADRRREDEVDATEIVLPQPSAYGFLSIVRVESDYTDGAAHARNGGSCETYSIATGKRLTVGDVLGARRAKALGDPNTTAFLMPAPFLIARCD
jgi:hypothetical protein